MYDKYLNVIMEIVSVFFFVIKIDLWTSYKKKKSGI